MKFVSLLAVLATMTLVHSSPFPQDSAPSPSASGMVSITAADAPIMSPAPDMPPAGNGTDITSGGSGGGSGRGKGKGGVTKRPIAGQGDEQEGGEREGESESLTGGGPRLPGGQGGARNASAAEGRLRGTQKGAHGRKYGKHRHSGGGKGGAEKEGNMSGGGRKGGVGLQGDDDEEGKPSEEAGPAGSGGGGGGTKPNASPFGEGSKPSGENPTIPATGDPMSDATTPAVPDDQEEGGENELDEPMGDNEGSEDDDAGDEQEDGDEESDGLQC